MERSQTAMSILTLLNNIDELVVKSNQRKEADDVMRAIELYAKNKDFKFPNDKADAFRSILLDARPNTISNLIFNIANDVMANDEKNARKKSGTSQ